MFDRIKDFDYNYIRVFLNGGSKIVMYNHVPQIDFLLKDANRVELLTDDSFVVITNDNIEILTKSI